MHHNVRLQNWIIRYPCMCNVSVLFVLVSNQKKCDCRSIYISCIMLNVLGSTFCTAINWFDEVDWWWSDWLEKSQKIINITYKVDVKNKASKWDPKYRSRGLRFPWFQTSHSPWNSFSLLPAFLDFTLVNVNMHNGNGRWISTVLINQETINEIAIYI